MIIQIWKCNDCGTLFGTDKDDTTFQEERPYCPTCTNDDVYISGDSEGYEVDYNE